MGYAKKPLPLVDIAKFYDNSSHSQPFFSVALLEHEQLKKQSDELPDWAKEILADYI